MNGPEADDGKVTWQTALVNLTHALEEIASARISLNASAHPHTETPEWMLESFDISLEMLLAAVAAAPHFPIPAELEARLRRFGDAAHEAIDWDPPDRAPDYHFEWYAAKLRGETPDPVALGAGTPNPTTRADLLASDAWSELAKEARSLVIALEAFLA